MMPLTHLSPLRARPGCATEGQRIFRASPHHEGKSLTEEKTYESP